MNITAGCDIYLHSKIKIKNKKTEEVERKRRGCYIVNENSIKDFYLIKFQMDIDNGRSMEK